MIIPSTVQTTSHAARLLQLEPAEDAAVPQHRMKRFVIKWELKGTSVPSHGTAAGPGTLCTESWHRPPLIKDYANP